MSEIDRQLQKFERLSREKQCARLLGATAWHAWRPDPNRLERTVTWNDESRRYWVHEIGSERTTVFNRTKVEHHLFEIASMSRPDIVTGQRQFEQWYLRPDRILYLRNEVDPANIEALTGHYVDAVTFMLENDLIHPHEKDIERLDYVLRSGYLDGVTELS